MYSVHVYVPDSHLEIVKQSMFTAGAGQIGNYDSCAWVTQGVGQFRPCIGSQPFLGREGQVEQVKEWKIEVVCRDEIVNQVVSALKKAHPYETPAYLVWKHENF